MSSRNYQKLKTMVKRRKDLKLRSRNFDARHERIETGAVVKNRKGLSGVEGGEKVFVKGDKCRVRNESEDHAQNRHRKPPHVLSHECHEAQECREAKVNVVPFFENRADII